MTIKNTNLHESNAQLPQIKHSYSWKFDKHSWEFVFKEYYLIVS